MRWNPEQYHRFQAERAAPFIDALGLVQKRPGLNVVDLGCGTGELTRRLADALPESDVLGIDSSPEMLSRAYSQSRPGLRFEQGNLQALEGRWDLIFSHAVIQWVDDHHSLVPALVQKLAPGGQLVVQLPSNHTHPTYLLMASAADHEPFYSALQGWRRVSPVLGVEAYADLLYAAGGSNIVAMEKVYPHILPDAAAMVEWTRGTTLIPYLERLPAALHEPFIAHYRELVQQAFPQSPVFYGFRRILFAATR